MKLKTTTSTGRRKEETLSSRFFKYGKPYQAKVAKFYFRQIVTHKHITAMTTRAVMDEK
jgi:hypothetical protein